MSVPPKCATCLGAGGLLVNITNTLHEGICPSCYDAWETRARKEPPEAMQRPGHVLALYRRWQAWRRATGRSMPVPREACA